MNGYTRGHRAVSDGSRLRCVLCGQPIVVVDESDHFAPFVRHKGVGYRWGDRARRLERLVDELAAALRDELRHEEQECAQGGYCASHRALSEVA